MKLYTTQAQYRDAADRMNAGRGKTVTVPRELFVALTLDHSRMAARLENVGERVEAGQPVKGE